METQLAHTSAARALAPAPGVEQAQGGCRGLPAPQQEGSSPQQFSFANKHITSPLHPYRSAGNKGRVQHWGWFVPRDTQQEHHGFSLCPCLASR